LTPNEKDIVYLAGIIDGEGYIGIVKYKTKPYVSDYTFTLRLTVTNTNLILMNWIQLNFGGTVHKHAPRDTHPNHRITYTWRIGCSKATSILRKVYPYLIVKQSEAKLAIKFQKQMKNYGPAGIPDSVYIKRVKMYKNLRLLKKGEQGVT